MSDRSGTGREPLHTRSWNGAEAGAVIGASVLVVLAAISAHARIGGSFAIGVALRVVHLGAMGMWVGGLVVLVALRRRTTPWERAALLRAFSPIALVSVAATVASGLLLTGREVRSLTALLTTGFGGVLLAKLLVLGIALGLGARHAAAVARGRHLGARTVAAEAAAVLVVVLGGAALATAVPAVGERFEPATAAPDTQVSQKVDDLLVRLTIGPSRPGRNLVRLELIDSRRPAPAPAVAARVVITDAAGASVSTAGGPPVGGVIELPAVDIAAPGPLQVRVEVDRPSRPVAPVDLSWSIEAAPAERTATVLSDASLAPWCLGAAGVVCLSAAIAWSRRRRPHGHRTTDRGLDAGRQHRRDRTDVHPRHAAGEPGTAGVTDLTCAIGAGTRGRRRSRRCVPEVLSSPLDGTPDAS